MSTITQAQQDAIRDYLDGRHIPAGLGDKEAACSVAAINLALTGELTDEIPECMSKVVGRWIIAIQDRMPDDLRNSSAWRNLLPSAAGTGRDREDERLALILDWMWEALGQLQPVADAEGYGEAWRTMCETRTAHAAHDAADAADATAATAATAARTAAYAAATSASAAYAASAASAASEASSAAVGAYAAVDGGGVGDPWADLDPPGLLRRLIHPTLKESR